MGAPSGMEVFVIILVLGIMIFPIIKHFSQEEVILKHNTLGEKKVNFMYSWISVPFGLFVPLFRGDIKWSFIYLLSAIFTGGIANIILAFYLNESYINNLINQGYKAADEESYQLLKSKNIQISKI